MLRLKWLSLLAPLLVLAFADAQTAGHAQPDILDVNTIFACVDPASGAFWSHPHCPIASDCFYFEKLESWNVQGAQGPAGPSGPMGSEGPQGPAGPAGTIPANLSAFASILGISGYTNKNFTYAPTCTIGDIVLSANSYGTLAIPADGTVYSISEYQYLFYVISNRFGGDGVKTFAVPDLRPAAPHGLQYSICALGIYPSQG